MRKFIVIFTFLLLSSALPTQAQWDVLNPGFYDDTNPSIAYTGTWSTDLAASGFSNLTTRSTSTLYSSVQFSFNGSGFSVASFRNTGFPTVTIALNKSTFTNVSLNGAFGLYSFGVSGLDEGIHTVRILLATADPAFYFDGVEILPHTSAPVEVEVSNFPAVQSVSVTNVPEVEVNNFPDSQAFNGLVPGFYDDQHPGVFKDSGWVESDDGLRYANTISTHDGDASLSFSVISDRVTVYLDALPDAQTFIICVDTIFPHVECDEAYILESGTAGTLRSHPVEINLGNYGLHEISIVKENDAHQLRFDGILVHEKSIDTWQVGDKTASFSNSMTAGDVSTAIFLTAITLIAFTALMIYLTKGRNS